jgi:hypothetical protein
MIGLSVLSSCWILDRQFSSNVTQSLHIHKSGDLGGVSRSRGASTGLDAMKS